MTNLKLETIQPWTPHPSAAPLTERDDGRFIIRANGTRTCVGGWQMTFAGAKAERAYLIEVKVEQSEIDNPHDTLRCAAYWGELPPTSVKTGNPEVTGWDYLLQEQFNTQILRFQRCLSPEQDDVSLTLRFTLRWSTKGSSTWSLPQIEEASTDEIPTHMRQSIKIAVVTGKKNQRQSPFTTVDDNISFYAPLCEAASQKNPSLIVLPEIALQWGIKGSPIDLAVPVTGPETEVFADIARRYRLRIMLGMLERDEDAVYNSAVLISPNGQIDGLYRKVHLAVGGEIESGISPGEGFPVFETEIGRIGCNICMDSSVTESSRMVGLNGADFLLLPIMGDHRAWQPGLRIFDPDRFRGIMQTRAMDNQVCMVVAVNRTEGSCIIDRLGNVLAWNHGDKEFILAKINVSDGYRPASKGCFRSINWMQRRPHLYQAFVDNHNRGSLLTKPY